MADRLPVNLGQFHQLHNVDAPVSALAFGDEIGRPAHHRGHFVLAHPSLFAGSNQALQKRVVGVLKLRRPSFS